MHVFRNAFKAVFPLSYFKDDKTAGYTAIIPCKNRLDGMDHWKWDTRHQQPAINCVDKTKIADLNIGNSCKNMPGI